MKKIALILLMLFSFSYGDFSTVDDTKLQKMMKDGVAVIDIRRVDEWNRFGIIPGSIKLTFFDKYGKYDVNAWMDAFTKIVKDRKEPFVLVCAHANRTKAVGQMLSEQAGFTNVFDLDGGIMYGWIDKGHKTTK